MARSTPIEQRIAARIRELRVARGLSQAELARRAGKRRSHVAAAESGKKDLRASTLEAFANALGVSIGDLVSAQVNPETVAEELDRAGNLAAGLRARGLAYVDATERVLTLLDRFASSLERG